MEKLSLKLYLIACLLLMKLHLFAQDDDDDDIISAFRHNSDSMDDMSDLVTPHLRITFSDIVNVALVLLASYIFGKIWKGCSYLIIALAVVFYILSR